MKVAVSLAAVAAFAVSASLLAGCPDRKEAIDQVGGAAKGQVDEAKARIEKAEDKIQKGTDDAAKVAE